MKSNISHFNLRILFPALLMGIPPGVWGDDWPAYRHDARRSASSAEQLEFPLPPAWRRTAARPPSPAFSDPYKHPTGMDFAMVRDFSQPVILQFDHAFHPVAADGRVYFGSSSDDAVRCLSLHNGKLQWVFVTGGPVRFAPQVVDGRRLYVGSDDGFVYCLAADDGRLIWKFRAAPSDRQLVGNGRMISRWPLRSGVLEVDGTVYVTAGMWPAEGVFVYALDAEFGSVKWVNDTSGTLNLPTSVPGSYAIAGVAPTGYLLAGKEALVVPTGRSFPATYALDDGRLLKSVAPSYQNKRGGPVRFIDPHGSVIFGYPRERLTGSEYSLHHVFQLPNLQGHGQLRADRMIAGEKKTYLVVKDLIRCVTFANSRYTSPKIEVHWQAECPSRSVHCLALSAESLLLGVDRQVIARDRNTGGIRWESGELDGYVQSLAVADGRILAATDAGSIYCFGGNEGRIPVADELAAEPAMEPSPELRKMLVAERADRGFAMVIGQGDTTLAERLAASSQLQVVLLLDRGQVDTARRELLKRGNPGSGGQVTVQPFPEPGVLPFADYAFNVILTTGDAFTANAAELNRVLRPGGGLLAIDEADPVAADVRRELSGIGVAGNAIGRMGRAWTYRRGKLAGALDWDSEADRDRRVKWPLELLWFGGPGSKRTGSGSRPPVAAGGRNLVVGKNHLIALDAYNGTELWARELPYLYRNIGRLKNAPGPIHPWLTESVSADDDSAWLNFGHVVYRLDAATGKQLAVHGEIPEAETFFLKDRPRFVLDHYRKPGERGLTSTPAKAPVPAGSIQLMETNAGNVQVILELDPSVEITDTLYWELFFDARPPERRANLYEPGAFHFVLKPAAGAVEKGIGPEHPQLPATVADGGRKMVLTLSIEELARLGGSGVDDFAFAAALNHQPDTGRLPLAGGRGYLRWEVHADAFAYAFNNGWPRIARRGGAQAPLAKLPPVSELPAHALRQGRIGGVGKKAGYVVNVARERENPLSLETVDFDYNRGKGCGSPVFSESLHVLRSGSLAFYDLEDDSGMRYFGGVRPSCTVSAVPAQGLVFAAEGSSGCNCNYNFKTTLALAPARQRRHEDWAVFNAPLSPAALLMTGRFNLGAPGDRRDDAGALWLQYPRAPTLPNRTMPVPVELTGEALQPYRINADRVPIANTDRPWLYASGMEGIEGIRLQLFMSDQEGVVVFPGEAPALDAKIEDTAWERRYAVPAGKGGSMLLAHDDEALHVGYEIVPPFDRRGQREAWVTRSALPHALRFAPGDAADDAAVWEEDSLEFLISDASLKTILHFGIGVTGGRYDGSWSAAAKKEDAAWSAAWSGAAKITAEKATAEFSIPWKILTDAGLDLETLVIRPRTKKPLTAQPHISHGFRPVLAQAHQPETRHYRVTLHFAELDNGIAPGQRVFDVAIQGQTVLKDFDPAVAAGGRLRAVAKTFERVPASRALEIRFSSRAAAGTKGWPPILSAVEVLHEP